MNGLVLEGGGVKGAYQIGAYYAFKKCNIIIDGFVGTSIGAFNAAMLACGKEEELLEFWSNVNPGKLLGFDDSFVESIGKKKSFKAIKGLFKTIKDVVKNLGIDNEGLMSVVSECLSEEELKSADKDFGFVTVKLPKMEPVYVYKDDIPDGKLTEYLMASAYLPVFKEKRIIDDHYYIDGGFHDNSPSIMLSDLGYKNIFVINIKGIGINRHHNPNGVNIINISPSRQNGSILELNQDVIRDNINMGYYDTLRVLKNYDGVKYCFKRKSDFYFRMITRKISKRELKRVMTFFRTINLRDTVVAAVDYIMDKEDFDYYKIYSVSKMIRKLRKVSNKHFVYQFVSKLKFI